MSASNLPDFSTLAAKPPQRPTANLASRPSTSNYASALASVTKQDNQSSEPNRPSNIATDGGADEGETAPSTSSGSAQPDSDTPSSASWRPNFNRQQSWNMQDRKRAMQSPLMSPALERGKGEDFGFRSKDGQSEQGTSDEA